MKTENLKSPFLALCIACLGSSVLLSADPVKVRALSINESRYRELAKSEGKSFPRINTLDITLELTGKPVETATHWGHLKFTTAKDDQGNDLVPSSGTFVTQESRDYVELNREHMWFFMDKKPKDKIKVDVRLKQPPRAATKLVKVTGVLKLGAARTQDVSSGPLKQLVGKKVSDKILEAAGISVQVTKLEKNSVALKINDAKEALQDVDVVDAKGESISSGSSSFTFGNEKQMDLSLDKQLPDAARLKFSVLLGRTEVEVPFSLEDIPLP